MDSAKESRTTTTNTKEKAFRLLLLPAKHENVTPKKKLYKKARKNPTAIGDSDKGYEKKP